MATHDVTLMPVDMYFVPSQDAIAKAKRLLKRYVYCDRIEVRTEETPFFVSGWYNCDQFVCPSCKKKVTSDFFEKGGHDWFQFLTDAAKAKDALAHKVILPCCNTETNLDKIEFTPRNRKKTAAIARFQICLHDTEDPINSSQVVQVQKVLGCKLIAIDEVSG